MINKVVEIIKKCHRNCDFNGTLNANVNFVRIRAEFRVYESQFGFIEKRMRISFYCLKQNKTKLSKQIRRTTKKILPKFEQTRWLFR